MILAGFFTFFYVLRAYYESVCHAPMSCRKLQLVVYEQTTPVKAAHVSRVGNTDDQRLKLEPFGLLKP